MSRPSILIVEDEVIVAENLKMILSGMGYTVPAIACNSTEALEELEKTEPDLILMDIVLEGSEFDGVETARWIRHTYEIPLVFVTAYADNETLERVKGVQPFAYILKPFNERELYSAIELALSRHRMEQEIKKRDNILFAISFAIEWFLRHQRESRKAKNGHPGCLEAGIVEILEHVGLAVNASMVAVFRLNLDEEGNNGAKVQYLWSDPGMGPPANPSNPSSPHLAFTTTLWRKLIESGNSLSGDIGKFPPEEQRIFSQCGVSSVAMFPLFKSDCLWGFVGISASAPRQWSEGEMEALMLAGNIVGAVLE